MIIYYVTDERLQRSSVESVHVHEVCKNLAALGHTVTLFAPQSSAFQSDFFTQSGSYTFVQIPACRLLFSVRFQLRLYISLKCAVRTRRPDIIYSRHNNLLVVPVVIGKVFKIPTVLEVNGQLLHESRLVDKSWVGRLLRITRIFYAIEYINTKFTTKLVAVAPGIKDYLIHNFGTSPEKVCVVPNGVNTDVFKPSEHRRACEKLGLNPEEIHIGYIGSLYAWQGLSYIIRAAESVVATRPNTKFIIIGKGSEAERLDLFVQEHQLNRSIEIRDAVPHETVPNYINALDICICYPTRFRNSSTSPFKAYEYLACGKAVVLADIEGMREEFGDTVAYVEPESVKSLSDTIRTLVDNAQLRESLGVKARAFVEEGRSWQAVSEKLLTVCTSALRR
jgi:glycosyltransferase involved in cell wall biosynthesis